MQSLFTTHWSRNIPESVTNSPEGDWLLDPGSLTRSISAVCNQTFTVTVLLHQFTTATAAMCTELDVAEGDSVLRREVLLCDGETPLVFACSLLPESALQGRFSALRDMGSRPLGHWIFKEPALQRTTMRFSTLPVYDSLFQRLWARSNNYYDDLWLAGRKTLFTGALKPFLVSEFFLPELQGRAGPPLT